MTVHVLPGDAQVEEFRKTGLEGETIVFREALIVGPVDAPDIDRFWDERAKFILTDYGEDEIVYHETVADEISKLVDLPPGTEINLWFEHELFCQVNMWFCLDLLKETEAEIYRVMPREASSEDVWKGFGQSDAEDLKKCFAERVRFSTEDIAAGARLWDAFRNRDYETLRELGAYASPALPHLKVVCEAAVQIETRPKEILAELKSSGLREFEAIFPAFQKRAGVYGYGDLQVERLLSDLN